MITLLCLKYTRNTYNWPRVYHVTLFKKGRNLTNKLYILQKYMFKNYHVSYSCKNEEQGSPLPKVSIFLFRSNTYAFHPTPRRYFNHLTYKCNIDLLLTKHGKICLWQLWVSLLHIITTYTVFMVYITVAVRM